MTVLVFKLRRMGETCFLGDCRKANPVLRKWWCLALRIGTSKKRAEECVLVSQPNVSACFESLSSTVQSAETIQESIGGIIR